MAREYPPKWSWAWVEEEQEDTAYLEGMYPDFGIVQDEPQPDKADTTPNPFSFLDGFEGLAKAQQGLNGNTASPLMGGALPQDYGDPLRIMQQEADEAKAKMQQQSDTYQSLIDEYNNDLIQRRESLRPTLSQAELDKRRAAGTMLATLTSALANLANGINVSKGGLNATVPDGYSVAYQHWNDIQKQQDRRKAEYDKITDAVWSNRLTQAKMKYGEASAEYQTLLAQIENAKNRRKDLQKTEMQEANKMDILEKRLESEERRNEATNKSREQVAKTNYSATVRKQELINEGKAASGSNVDLEDYRTYSGTNGTIAIPDDMDVEDGYLAMANAALDYLDTIQETTANKTELANKKKALREALTGSNKDKVAKLKKLSTAIANSGVSQEELEAALNVTHQDNGGTESDNPNAIFG